MKIPLINSLEEFSYSKNCKSFLFNGTKINKCQSNNKDIIRALVLNIGFNTNRGNLIQNVLFPNESNFEFSNHLKIYFFSVIVLFIFYLTIFLFIFMKYKTNTDNNTNNNNLTSTINTTNQNSNMNTTNQNSCFSSNLNTPSTWTNFGFIINVSLILTTIIPPVLPISLTFTTFYFQYKLNNKKISSATDQKIITAGKVNVVVLDKTGTMTEDGLELHGFLTTKINYVGIDQVIRFDEIERNSKTYNSVHKEFWKRYCINPDHTIFENYKNNLRNNIIYFLECLASCQTLDVLQGETMGNSIDKTIFDSLKWILQKARENIDKNTIVSFKNFIFLIS